MKKILIVDDNAPFAEALKITLRSSGFSIDTAFNGITALEMFCSENYNILLSDIHMPDLSGIELASKIADLYPRTQIILMSSFPSDIIPGGFYYLHKPLNEEVLVKIINT